jgi:Xylose isomerase-like TIM barrel
MAGLDIARAAGTALHAVEKIARVVRRVGAAARARHRLDLRLLAGAVRAFDGAVDGRPCRKLVRRDEVGHDLVAVAVQIQRALGPRNSISTRRSFAAGAAVALYCEKVYIGAALWDIAPAMDRLDPRWAGYYFDPRHAVAEGGGGAWKAATYLVAPRLKMLAVKDCVWTKSGNAWRIDNCPLGDGLVDWAWVGAALGQARFSGPISIHLEYEIRPGTRHTLDAATRDLSFARRFL